MNNQQSIIPNEHFADIWEEWLSGMPEFLLHLLESLFVILILLIIRFILLRVINRRVSDSSARYHWRKNLVYVLSFVGFLMIGRIWFEGIASLATFLGLLSAGVVIALRDPLVDMAGWVFLLWRKPFELGDRVQIGEDRGDVVDIRLFKFTLLEIGNWVHADQSTGRVVHIPNRKVFEHPVANYTSQFEFIWHETEVNITYESDWQRARSILEEIADQQLREFVDEAKHQLESRASSYLIHYRHLTPFVYTDVGEYGIRLTIRYLVPPRNRRSISMKLWEGILTRFGREQSIELAYQTYRIFRRPQEENTLRRGDDPESPGSDPAG